MGAGGVGRPLPGWVGPSWVETGERVGKGGCSAGSAPAARLVEGRGGRDRAKGGADAVLPGVGALPVCYRISRPARPTYGAAGVSELRSHTESRGSPRIGPASFPSAGRSTPDLWDGFS